MHPQLSHSQLQQVQNGMPPASHHSQMSQRYDDLQFFDRVKRALENRETYNEFLKLVNLFTQDIIDTARLVREARNYLGDGELMVQFREILGWDDRRDRYAGSEDVWTRPTGVLDRPSRNQLSLRHGSYRKLPVTVRAFSHLDPLMLTYDRRRRMLCALVGTRCASQS